MDEHIQVIKSMQRACSSDWKQRSTGVRFCRHERSEGTCPDEARRDEEWNLWCEFYSTRIKFILGGGAQ